DGTAGRLQPRDVEVVAPPVQRLHRRRRIGEGAHGRREIGGAVPGGELAGPVGDRKRLNGHRDTPIPRGWRIESTSAPPGPSPPRPSSPASRPPTRGEEGDYRRN